MTADQIRTIRSGLGLTQRQLGEWLRLSGANPGHTVRMWETGKRVPSGPAAVCLQAFASGYRPEHVLQD